MKSVALRMSLYLTPEHACSYYADRKARTVFGDPGLLPNIQLQTQLAQKGFRRSGKYIYRPECRNCSACIPARVNVAAFKPNRSQRRNLRDNRDIETVVQRPWCSDELLALYNRYQQWRHPDGQMIAAGTAEYADFLLSSWSRTHYLEMRIDGELAGVAVFDRLKDGLSAVYTFYSPDAADRGLGTFAILKLIELAESEGLERLYLGYWLPEHPRMDYKRRFQPLEIHVGDRWLQTETGVAGSAARACSR